VKAAIAADPSLLDREAVGKTIFRARYGSERWKKRVERTRKLGVGVLDCQIASNSNPLSRPIATPSSWVGVDLSM